MSSYARGTEVDASKSRMEIERLLLRAKCTHVGVMHEPDFATIYFRRDNWVVQMRIRMPNPDEAPTGWRTPERRLRWVEQRSKERWRQLLLVLKAKFTALEEGVETFEETFMAHLVLGNFHVGQKLLPAMREARDSGGPLMLPPGGP